MDNVLGLRGDLEGVFGEDGNGGERAGEDAEKELEVGAFMEEKMGDVVLEPRAKRKRAFRGGRGAGDGGFF